MQELFNKEIKYCSFCPKMCRFACPVAIVSKNETLTPWGKMSLLYLWGKEEAKSNNDLSNIVYKCTTCLICRTYCKHKIEVAQVMEAARRQMVNEGNLPPPVKDVLQQMRTSGNPYGEDLNKILEDIIPTNYQNTEAHLLYFPGCSAIKYFPEDITDTVKILKKLNQNFTVYTKTNLCCGSISYTLGDEKMFNNYVKKNLSIFNKYKIIISNCPLCVKILKKNYKPRLKSNLLHITEYLSLFLHTEVFSNPLKIEKRVIYHDPCYLGRHLQTYEAPRKLLDRFCRYDFLEFSLNYESSACCGWGGGMIFSNPLLGQEISYERCKELKESDVQVLATACPSCKHTFINTTSLNFKEIEVKDIINLIAQSI